MEASTFNPQNVSEFEKSKVAKDANGVSGTAVAGQTTNIDLVLADDMLITGGFLLAQNANQGDYCHFKVMAGPTLAAQFVTNWFIDPSQTKQQTPQSNFPAKIPAGLTLRVSYVNVGATDVWVAINYDLNKVLI
jgi:hypothetical protein